jgi:hypothetical protein
MGNVMIARIRKKRVADGSNCSASVNLIKNSIAQKLCSISIPERTKSSHAGTSPQKYIKPVPSKESRNNKNVKRKPQ